MRWRVAVGLVAIGGVLAGARVLDIPGRLREALGVIGALGPWGVLLFVGLYVAATVLFLPGWILTLGAGAVFGVAKGVVTVSVAATLGATAAFLVGRHGARALVTRRLEGSARFRALDDAVARGGWKIVGLARLSPAFPFNLLNYAFGLTRIPLLHYVLASWAGMLPGTALYVYLGSLAGDLAALDQGTRARTPAEWAFYGVGLLATGAATVYITRLARAALDRRLAS